MCQVSELPSVRPMVENGGQGGPLINAWALQLSDSNATVVISPNVLPQKLAELIRFSMWYKAML